MLALASDLGHLFRTEHDRLMRAMRRLVGSPSTAEDLVQDVFVGLLRGNAFADAENKQAYLARCATNMALDHLRRERARARYICGSDLAGCEVACPVPLPDEALQGVQELALLRRTIDALPSKCRVVFLLSRDHGLTMKEIAARLGLSDKTVEKHIARAMMQCRQALRAAGRAI
ncbi:RNA polymerase sigma-70 factor (ECF subfamily) [Ancylobacter aquaticus]|uniref:RNA polymerase sigma-70 factor (ECF subfamily) n=1 Tax=Ancylobacter aquaticus TaxID=100 RepID=A0A4R1H631_ANCAQ|nr:sigma-70 family RNA polymerase sigma factor [Ancylobacter aquaticus]TCK16578.1 RNA polymerase sigma-70 factor (ECF subfamily) [Ancylobacter aquaticus]